MRRFAFITFLCLFIPLGLSAKSDKSKAKSALPISREAVLVESSSPTEILIRATGYGTGSDNAEQDKRANSDALKAAVWFLLFGGTDPLLQTPAEKSAFTAIQDNFFKLENLKPFISWEAEYYEARLKIDGGKRLKIEKSFKINKALIQDDLIKKGILTATMDLSGSLGNPTIMVLPESRNDRSPLELLRSDPDLKKGAEVIEAFLTARKFDVIVPEQQQVLQELVSAQTSLKGEEEDYSYLLALSIGSDVYITYNVAIEARKVGSATVKKGVVGCRAYETTTGRLLGTETGYSQERPVADAVLVEEALNDAIDKVLSRVTAYWKSDLQLGVQYKILLTISNSFDRSAAEDIIYGFADQVRKVARNTKELVVADYTYDVLVWCEPQKYRNSSDVYRFLKENYKGTGQLSRVSISRKLILLNIGE